MVRIKLHICRVWKSLLILLTIFITINLPLRTFATSEILTESTFFASAHQTLETDFNLVGNLIVVQAKVNQTLGNYIIDTGADISMVNAKYFKKQGWPLDESNVGFTGKIGPLRRSHASFTWQHFHLKWVAFNVLDLSHIEKVLDMPIHGFIGFDILKRFEVTIDYAASSLTLVETKKKSKAGNDHPISWPPDYAFSFRMNRHLPCLSATIGEHTIDLGIDLGSAVNLLSGKIWGQLVTHAVPCQPVKLVGFAVKGVLGQTFQIEGLKIANQMDLPMSRFTLHNTDQINRVLAYPVHGMLGFEALSPYRLRINYRKKELLLWSMPNAADQKTLKKETLAE